MPSRARRWVYENLVTKPNSFDDSSWSKLSGATVDADAFLSPRFTQTCDRLNDPSNTQSGLVGNFFTAVKRGKDRPHTALAYVKNDSQATNRGAFVFKCETSGGSVLKTAQMIVSPVDGTYRLAAGGDSLRSGSIALGPSWGYVFYLTLPWGGSTTGRWRWVFYPAIRTDLTSDTFVTSVTGSCGVWGATIYVGDFIPPLNLT